MAIPASRWKTWTAYLAMMAAAVGLFLVIRNSGETLTAPAATANDPTHGVKPEGRLFFHVLLALTAVIVLGRVLGWLFAWVHQPPVIGEVVAGILLGPSLLGRIAPDVAGYILPPEAAPHLGIVAQFGIILYMFLVGLELNTSLLREKAHATVAISHASIVVPFVLGSSLALDLYPRLSHSGVPFTSFALFLGVAMAITAFPVLARILQDRGMSRTQLGVVALTCAATDDVTAWCLLALVVGVAQAKVEGAVVVILLTVAYIAFMFLVVRPVVNWWMRASRANGASLTSSRWRRKLARSDTAIVFVALLLSSLTTELIGVHAVFGAFLLGAVIPHDCALARRLTRNLEGLVTILLLPAFFAFTGMRTEIGLLDAPEHWIICGVIVLVASVGKVGGTMAAGRLSGLDWRTATSLGFLMNTRGLMGLIVLNVGLDLGVISPRLYAMMVIMALVTTVATTPVLHALQKNAADSSD